MDEDELDPMQVQPHTMISWLELGRRVGRRGKGCGRDARSRFIMGSKVIRGSNLLLGWQLGTRMQIN